MQPITKIPYDPSKPNNVLKLLNFDENFRRMEDRAIILNNIDYNIPGYADVLTNNVYSRVGDFNFIARCACSPGEGGLEGTYTEGMICPKCKQRSVSGMDAISGHLDHMVWLSSPTSIPGFMHPNVYMVWARWAKADKSTGYIDAIVNPKLPLPAELAEVVPDKQRGWKFLHDNYDTLCDFFLNHLKKTRDKATPALKVYLQSMRHLTFCRYLPVLASVLHPIIQSDQSRGGRKFVDQGSQYILEAANGLSYLQFAPSPPTKHAEIQDTIHTAYKSYMLYLDDIARRRMSKKQSLPRRHVLGARFHWSFRSVIVPICGPHRYDELHLPWCVGVNNLKVHIIGRLMQRHGHTLGDATYRQLKAITHYDPLVHRIMKEMIAESPYPGLPVLFNRNPSLKRGSIQLLWATEIKDNVKDDTIGMSVLVLKDPNADKRLYAQSRMIH